MFKKFQIILCIMIAMISGFILIPANAYAQLNSYTLSEIEPFFDTYFAEKMEEYHVPGAAFVLVKDGEPILAKGYGYANLEQGTPVDYENTVFRVASLSKIYVLMALLKLQEEGLLSIEDDITKFLPENDPLFDKVKGIAIKHLLTHTEGFPSKDVGTFVLQAEDIPPIYETLLKDLKSPNLEPGKGVAYGGMGSVLAAYIIERITGQSFDQYIEEKFLTPLAMHKSTFLQDLPGHLRDSLAVTYIFEDDKYEETRFLYGVTPPSGGLSSTAADVSQLLIALMNNGTYQGNQILTPETIKLMIQSQFRGHEHLPGVTYGFFEIVENGKRALIRDGSGFGVTTRLFYIPEDKVGFVYFQNIRGDELLDDLTSTFFDYFYPDKGEQQVKGIPLVETEVKELEGTYRAMQHHQNIMKIGSFLSGMVLNIKANDDGTLHLVVSGPGDVSGWGGFGKETTLTQIEPMLFARSDAEGYVAFSKDGDSILMHTSTGYHSTYVKLPWYETATFQLICLSLFVATFLITLVVALIQWIKRKSMKLEKTQKRFMLIAGIISFLNLAFPYPLFHFAFIRKIEGFPAVAFGIPEIVQVLLFVPVVTGILALILGVVLIKIFLNKQISLGRKMGYAFIVVISLLFIPFTMYWHIFPGLA